MPVGIKAKVKLKYHNQCKVCGTKENLHIHHKDKNWKNNDLNNLVLLCKKHHWEVHGGWAGIAKLGANVRWAKRSMILNEFKKLVSKRDFKYIEKTTREPQLVALWEIYQKVKRENSLSTDGLLR